MLHLLFFFSGALGLVYEVLWMRRLTPLFGATTLATTATLSAFFLGLALGSIAFGGRARTWRRPLQAFGVLEIGVGIGALLVPAILDLYRPLYPALAATFAESPAAFAVVKLLLAMIAIGIPTFCMGGTLPALGEAVASSGRSLGVPVGGLYATNLLGATLGALAVPFVLLPHLGVERSSMAAVAGSLAIGLIACILGRSKERPPAAPTPPPKTRGPRRVLALAVLSGVFTLALQTLWTRMFSLVHESSIYSFAIVLVLFLLGLAGGAAGARAALRRGQDPDRLLAASWAAAGVLVAVSPLLFHRLTEGLEYLPTGDWMSSLARLIEVAVPVLLPASVALGMALPLLMEKVGRESAETAGPALGRLLALNTVGAIVGPLLATFILGPTLGLWMSLVLLGAAMVAAGDRVGLAPPVRGMAWGTLLVITIGRPDALPPVRVAAGQRLVSVREGTHGTTAVLESDHDRWITVNNSYILGGRAAAGEERWQAHLPLFLHPSPKRVAFLGMGTGITAGAALLHPVERLVALEIVPEVVTAAGEDFADANAGLARDPRVRVISDDGRHYLAAPAEPFDVIVGDLLVPWRPAEAALYTREHFESVRGALAPDGVFCQWLPVYQLSKESLAVVLRTFADVFPQATLWRGNFLPEEPALALVGHLGTRALNATEIDRRVAALAPSIDAENPFLQHPAGLWLFLVGPLPADATWLGPDDGRRNRDGSPWLELMSPRRETAIVGAPLQSLLAPAAAHTLSGTVLRDLDEAHRGWRKTGAALALASLTPGEDGARGVFEILRTLPMELQESLGVNGP